MGNVTPLSRRRIFAEGLLTNILNPKMAIFVLALFPQFYEPDAGPMVLQFFILAMIINVFGLIANGAVILVTDKLGVSFMRQGRMSAIPQYLLGAVFAGPAARLIFDNNA